MCANKSPHPRTSDGEDDGDRRPWSIEEEKVGERRALYGGEEEEEVQAVEEGLEGREDWVGDVRVTSGCQHLKWDGLHEMD